MKYEFVNEDTITSPTGVILTRIRALVDIYSHGVKVGNLGGYLESGNNLSQHGTAWVDKGAHVFGSSLVSGHVFITDNARIYGDAHVFGDARVYGNARVYDNSKVFGHAMVYGEAKINGETKVYGESRVWGSSRIAQVYQEAQKDVQKIQD